MNLLFVLFLVKAVISAGESSDETKYIDLLPDKEKKYFLDTLARRIFKSVKSKEDRDNEDVGVSHLDVQDAFIKKIIEDESSNLRKNDDIIKYDNDNHQDDDSHEIKKEDEDSLKIINDEEPIVIEINKHDDDLELSKKEELEAEDNQIDLTLRQGKRNKRNISLEHEQSNEDSKIIRISTGNLNEDINIPSKDESDREDIQIKQFKRIMPGILNDFDITTQSSDSHKITQMIDFDADAVKDKSGENIATSKDNQVTTTEDPVNSEKGVTVDNVNDDNFSSTQKIYGSFESLSKSLESKKGSSSKEPVTEVFKDSTISTTDISNIDPSEVNIDRTKVTVSKEKVISVNTEKAVIATDTNNTKKDIDESMNQSVHILRSFAENETIDENQNVITKITTEKSSENTTINDRVILTTLDFKRNDTITSENLSENSTISNSEQTVTTVAFEYNNKDIIKTVTVQVLTTDEDSKNDNITNSGTTIVQTSTSPSITSKESSREKKSSNDVTILQTEGVTKASLRSGINKELENKNITLQINETKTNNAEVKDGIVRIELETSNAIKVSIKNNLNGNIKSDNKTDQQSYSLANDMIKVLRQKLQPETDLKGNNVNGLTALYVTTKPKEFNVYEVSADKQPFLQKVQLDNQENPFYVPIYDYSPKNAYFNPHNRFGPNADSREDLRTIINFDDINDRKDNDEFNDNDSHTSKRDGVYYFASNELIKDDTQSLKSILKNLRIEANKNQRKFHFGFSKQKKIQNSPFKLNLLPVIVNYPKYTDIYLNPNDYLDMDYYYGRTKKTALRNRCEHSKIQRFFKDSKHGHKSKKYHLNEIEKEDSLKSHMRAVRMMLYRQKHFGKIPPTKMNFTGNFSNIFVPSEDSSEDEFNKNYKDTNHTHTDHPIALRSKLKESNVNGGTTQSNKNIAMDYFFGRMSDDTDYSDTRTHSNYINNNNNKPKENRKDPKNNFNSMVNNISQKDYKDKSKHKSNLWNTLYDILKKAYMHENLNKNYKNSIKYDIRPKNYGNKLLHNEIKPATPAYLDIPIGRAKKKKKYLDFNVVNQILNMTDATDLLPTLDKLLNVNRTMGKNKLRSGSEDEVEPYVTVLEDMVANDAKPLKQYDWLRTTVDVQAALAKMMDMTDVLIKKQKLSNLDLQLVKYSIYIHKSILQSDKDYLRKNKLLPRNKNKKKGFLKETFGLKSRNWLYRKLIEASLFDEMITSYDLNSFDRFLNNVQYYLNDLHQAIQQIANITQYNNQNWFKNLKELYLDTQRKHILEVLLHLTMTRLLDLVEESAKQGLEDDFLTYVMKNEKEVERTKAEFTFAHKIIDEFKNLGDLGRE